MAFVTVKPKKNGGNHKDLMARVDMAQLLVDIGFEDVNPDAEEQLLFCVFHNDSATPSFSVNLEKKVFHCFSAACGARGSAISLYALWKNIDYEQAVNEIQYMPKRRSMDTLQRTIDKERNTMTVERRLKILTDFTLKMPDLSQTEHAEYLVKRGISKSTMDWYGFKAYDPQVAESFDPDHLFAAGVANVWRNPIFTSHQILFPFWLGDSVVYLQGRLSEDNPDKIKYMGARGTVPCVFGHNALRRAPKAVYITEGVVDAISLGQMGYAPALGIIGTEGFKPDWTEEFKGVKEVWIATDNDDAGNAAYIKLVGMLQDHVPKVDRFIFPGEFKDINAWMQSKI
jgi:DNA primase